MGRRGSGVGTLERSPPPNRVPFERGQAVGVDAQLELGDAAPRERALVMRVEGRDGAKELACAQVVGGVMRLHGEGAERGDLGLQTAAASAGAGRRQQAAQHRPQRRHHLEIRITDTSDYMHLLQCPKPRTWRVMFYSKPTLELIR